MVLGGRRERGRGGGAVVFDHRSENRILSKVSSILTAFLYIGVCFCFFVYVSHLLCLCVCVCVCVCMYAGKSVKS